MSQKDSEISPSRDSALTRSGYLLQLNIASTGKLIGVNRTIQSSKKRWHTLKMNYEGTGFNIESSKPGRGAGTVGKSVVPLVTCISVRKSIKGPAFSFESGSFIVHLESVPPLLRGLYGPVHSDQLPRAGYVQL